MPTLSWMITRPSWGTSISPLGPTATPKPGSPITDAGADRHPVADQGEADRPHRRRSRQSRPIATPGPITACGADLGSRADLNARRRSPRRGRSIRRLRSARRDGGGGSAGSRRLPRCSRPRRQRPGRLRDRRDERRAAVRQQRLVLLGDEAGAGRRRRGAASASRRSLKKATRRRRRATSTAAASIA